MSGLPFLFQGKGGLEIDIANLLSQQEKKQVNSFTSTEPTSVLHMRRSPSPPTSASTLSSSFNGGAAAAEKTERKDEWATLQPIPTGLNLVSTGERCGLGLEDWENMLSEPNQEQSLLRWIAGDVDDSFGLRQALNKPATADFDGNGLGIVDHGAVVEPIVAGFGFNGNSKVGSLVSPPSSSGGLLCHKKPISGQFHGQIEVSEGKPQILDPHLLINQNPNFFLPPQEIHLLQPHSKRHNSGGFIDSIPQIIPKLQFHQQQQQHHLGVQFLQKPPPTAVKKEEINGGQQQALLDELYKAAELIGTGNYLHAQGILARLNQHLSQNGKPLQRAAFYFKEALQLLIVTNTNPVSAPLRAPPTPYDVIFKMGAYKAFSEISPLIQFINFTSNQALLEAIGDSKRIHIIDFDIGFGAQWASFMQELRGGPASPSLKITAFASPSTHNPLETFLMRENLTQFANDNGISFELDLINFDSLLDQSCYSLFNNSEEVVAVNFPVWCSSNQPSLFPSLLRFIRQISPKIVVSLDRGCDRTDLPFSQHILHGIQSYIHLFESLDAVNVGVEAVNKIEKFLIQPRIESSVMGRIRSPDKMPNWKSMFASAGFTPVTFSNYSETQAECVVNRTPVRGFHVEKRQALLVLCWQRRELVSASAWRC